MKRFSPFLIAGILVVVIVGVASALAALDPGSGSVDFTVMNLDSGQPTDVTAQYINQSGDVDAVITKTLQTLSSKSFMAADSGLPDNWVGSAIVSAQQEIAAIAQIKWEGGTSADGKTAGAYDAFRQGENELYFPSLAARDGLQYSILTIQSAETPSTSETIDAYITFYDRNGNVSLGPIVRTINTGAQATIDLIADVSLPITNPPATEDGWLGSAVVTSTHPIAGVASTHWPDYSAAYSAVSSGGTTLYLPSGTRRLPNGPWLQFTSVEVQNLEPVLDAEVTVYWYDRDNNVLYSFTDTIPANASHGYNTRFTGSNVPDHAALHAALGDNWNGSLVIESTNSTEIVGIVKLQWTSDHPAGAGGSSYYSLSSGYPEVFIPAVYRRVDGDWVQFSGLIVQNLGLTACNNFTVEWRDQAGNVLLSFTDSLDPSIAHGYNTRYAADNPLGVNMEDLGTALDAGSVYFDAPGCSLNAIHNTVWPGWTDSTTYNVFGR